MDKRQVGGLEGKLILLPKQASEGIGDFLLRLIRTKEFINASMERLKKIKGIRERLGIDIQSAIILPSPEKDYPGIIIYLFKDGATVYDAVETYKTKSTLGEHAKQSIIVYCPSDGTPTVRYKGF